MMPLQHAVGETSPCEDFYGIPERIMRPLFRERMPPRGGYGRMLDPLNLALLIHLASCR